jgi:hypothetical protein
MIPIEASTVAIKNDGGKINSFDPRLDTDVSLAKMTLFNRQYLAFNHNAISLKSYISTS